MCVCVCVPDATLYVYRSFSVMPRICHVRLCCEPERQGIYQCCSKKKNEGKGLFKPNSNGLQPNSSEFFPFVVLPTVPGRHWSKVLPNAWGEASRPDSPFCQCICQFPNISFSCEMSEQIRKKHTANISTHSFQKRNQVEPNH